MTKFTRITAISAVALSLAACEATTTQEIATRATPQMEATQPAGSIKENHALRLTQAYTIRDIEVIVPEDLRVSEANVYYPNADIVWRGDAPGDRHKQVKAIFEEAFKRGSGKLNEGVPADLRVEVTRFHSLTEKTRYTFGGVHSVKFRLTVLDPKTGAELESRVVDADLKAYGGAQAVAMEAKGVTQKARLTQHLANVLVNEMSASPLGG
ncbi:DUF6778 family protein [Vannielia sp.]|uniref:DUF6778 family protein n=1 Tax=Vannielia sp. TaxID=2813045 RepID=UPI00262F46E5|nr:DUF6778 family protein [Vannielia sp.]MDF1873382.1 hypothetical protein [Vannielia sp.]